MAQLGSGRTDSSLRFDASFRRQRSFDQFTLQPNRADAGNTLAANPTSPRYRSNAHHADDRRYTRSAGIPYSFAAGKVSPVTAMTQKTKVMIYSLRRWWMVAFLSISAFTGLSLRHEEVVRQTNSSVRNSLWS
jgi:hypothetical protein